MANRLECNDTERKMMRKENGSPVSPHSHIDSMAFPRHPAVRQIIVARSGQFAETTPFRVLHHTCGNIR